MDFYCVKIRYHDLTPPGEYRLFGSKCLTTVITLIRIGQASKVPLECVSINHDLIRDGTLSLSDIDKILSRTVNILSHPP